jgi:D-alanine-D-alanine ligase
MSFTHLQPAQDSAAKCGRVAVLMGGTAAEREVSLKSGSYVLQGLLDAGVDAFAVDIQHNICQQLSELKADRVFNILHGRVGEDGQVQGLLESLNIPYVGSSIRASAVTMDKLMTKRVLQGCGLQTPVFCELNSVQDCKQALDLIGLPMIIKPVLEGSSIGMTKVSEAAQLEDAYLLAARFGPVLAEQWIVGSEYTVAWMGGTVLPAIRLETPHTFYDYDAKYIASDTRYICPCGLADDELQQLNKLVARTAEICGIRHWGRIDLMRDQQGVFQVIEVNTVPGMTDHSLVPMAAKEAGLSFSQLVLKLVEYTLDEEKSNA